MLSSLTHHLEVFLVPETGTLWTTYLMETSDLQASGGSWVLRMPVLPQLPKVASTGKTQGLEGGQV